VLVHGQKRVTSGLEGREREDHKVSLLLPLLLLLPLPLLLLLLPLPLPPLLPLLLLLFFFALASLAFLHRAHEDVAQQVALVPEAVDGYLHEAHLLLETVAASAVSLVALEARAVEEDAVRAAVAFAVPDPSRVVRVQALPGAVDHPPHSLVARDGFRLRAGQNVAVEQIALGHVEPLAPYLEGECHGDAAGRQRELELEQVSARARAKRAQRGCVRHVLLRRKQSGREESRLLCSGNRLAQKTQRREFPSAEEAGCVARGLSGGDPPNSVREEKILLLCPSRYR
jgi:hypothetical protein